MRLSGRRYAGPSAAISASVRLALSSPNAPGAGHTTRSQSGLRLGHRCQVRVWRAGCSQRNVQQYRRTAYSSTTACKSHRALAGVLKPHIHADQQIGLSKPFRQEITRCLVREFFLSFRFARRRSTTRRRQCTCRSTSLTATRSREHPHPPTAASGCSCVLSSRTHTGVRRRLLPSSCRRTPECRPVRTRRCRYPVLQSSAGSSTRSPW